MDGANLVFPQLTGQARRDEAMVGPNVGGWMENVVEAPAGGRAAGLVLVAPSFGISDPTTPLLTLPLARYGVPLLAERARSFAPLNAGRVLDWMAHHPTDAVLTMAALVQSAKRQDHAAANMPARFYLSQKDHGADPEATQEVQAHWSGDMSHDAPGETGSLERLLPVMAKEIMLADNTAKAVAMFTRWPDGLGL